MSTFAQWLFGIGMTLTTVGLLALLFVGALGFLADEDDKFRALLLACIGLAIAGLLGVFWILGGLL